MPPGFPRIVLVAMFLIAIAGSGWIVLDTQRVMKWMASPGPEWWPGRATAIRLADKPVWVWVYRIAAAVVFVGSVAMLLHHVLAF